MLDIKSKIAVVIIIVMICVSGYFAISITSSRLSKPQRDVLIVGTSTPFPPFESRAGDNVIGLDMDLAEAVAKRLNRRLIIKDFSDFDALLPALKSGSIDMVIAGLTITDNRKEIVNFSDAYYNSSQSILTLTESNVAIDSYDNLTIGYQLQTTSEFWLADNGINNTVSFSDLSMGLQYLRIGTIDVIIIDKPVADAFAQKYTDLKVIKNIETSEQYGIAIQKNDPENMLPAINQLLSEMKSNGEYEQLLQKWFGD